MALPLPEPLQSFETSTVSLERVESLAAEFRAKAASGKILPNVLEALRVELTYHSNALEGNTLSLRETQLVIEGQTPPGQKSLREIYEARNHDRAFSLIEQCAQTRPASSPLTEQDIRDVHAQVLTDIDTVNAGHFRKDRVLIAGTGFIPPGAHKIPVLIPALVELANRPGLHAIVQAAELHYNLVAVHPFNNGNGRTARLMMNYHLLRHGFPPAIIKVTRRAEYLSALDEANAGRIDPFLKFIAESLARSIQEILGNPHATGESTPGSV